MCGVKFKLYAIILVLHVTGSTESDVRQLPSSGEDEEPLKLASITKQTNKPPNISYELPKSDEDNEYDQYYEAKADDENDKTRKRRHMLIQEDYFDGFEIKKRMKKSKMNHKEKCRLSQIWKDRIDDLILKKFMPYKEYKDLASGQSTSFYKPLSSPLSSPTRNFNLEKAYFTTINDFSRKPHHEAQHQHNFKMYNLRIQTDNETVSDNVVDKDQVLDNSVVTVNVESMDAKSGMNSVPLTNDQSDAPLRYSIGDNISEVADTTGGTEKTESNSDSSDSTNQSHNFESIFMSRSLYNSAYNADIDNTQKLPSNEYPNSFVLGNNDNRLNPSVPKFDYPYFWVNKNHPFLFMPSSSYQNYVANTVYVPSYPTQPIISENKILESYDSMDKHYPFLDDRYNLHPGQKLPAPFKLDNLRPYNWYQKDYDYQLPTKYNTYDKMLFQILHPANKHHGFHPPGSKHRKVKPKVQEYLSSNSEVPKGEYGDTNSLYSLNPKVDNQNDAVVISKFDLYIPDNMLQTSTIRDYVQQDWPYEKSEPDSSYYNPGYQTVRPLVKNAECGEGTKWTSNCHICSCNYGKAVCEKQANCKLRPFGEPMLCKPYSRFKLDDCYVCECNGDGIPECSIQDCKQDMESKSQQESNQRYDGVARARLIKYNHYYRQLSDYCPPQNKLPTCEKWTVWTSRCYECKCNEDGRRECVKMIGCQLNPKEYGKPARCKPNSTISPRLPLLCHQCQCDDEGKPFCLLSRHSRSRHQTTLH